MLLDEGQNWDGSLRKGTLSRIRTGLGCKQNGVSRRDDSVPLAVKGERHNIVALHGADDLRQEPRRQRHRLIQFAARTGGVGRGNRDDDQDQQKAFTEHGDLLEFNTGH